MKYLVSEALITQNTTLFSRLQIQGLEILTVRDRSTKLVFEIREHCGGEGIATLPYINELLYLNLRCIKYVSLRIQEVRNTRKKVL